MSAVDSTVEINQSAYVGLSESTSIVLIEIIGDLKSLKALRAVPEAFLTKKILEFCVK